MQGLSSHGNVRALFEEDRTEASNLSERLSSACRTIQSLVNDIPREIHEWWFTILRILQNRQAFPPRALLNDSVTSPSQIRIRCISDTHNELPPIPLDSIDLLIHAGDLTEAGTEKELALTLEWLQALPIPHKVFVGGNHDFALEELTPAIVQRRYPSLRYLNDTYLRLKLCDREVAIYGTLRTPRYGGFTAFSYAPGEEQFDHISQPCDILVSHGPAYGYVDTIQRKHVGCPGLLQAVRRLRPHMVVSGHIHVAGGSIQAAVLDNLERLRLDGTWFSALASLFTKDNQGERERITTAFVNAAIADSSKAKFGVVMLYDSK